MDLPRAIEIYEAYYNAESTALQKKINLTTNVLVWFLVSGLWFLLKSKLMAGSANQKPQTRNHKPETTNQKPVTFL
jgi:hypothetical protein